ncbi:trichohyalin-like [Uloborus diversus]|uniref:trichohyalin-like n=1 Tax=Uloborus diversus TaxID=327109 RepID=UPI0024094C01|nr:trichohyalin-like [Uloborus diversus]
MGAAVEDSLVPDRIYVHQLNLTSADVRRRQREKQMVEEEKRKVLEMKEIKRRQKEEEKRRDMEMLLSYDPWGKPGAGAKGGDSKRKKYPEGRLPDETLPEEETMEGFIRKFGKPGAGAPMRTESGRIRTQIPGHPDIRFQDTQHVRLSIENQLRYKNEDKENYRGNLNELIQQKQQLQEQEKEWESKKLEEMRELYPFGREDNNNGGSYLSHTDPMFMPTRPRKLERKMDDFDPWGKGFGNPSRDRRGNVQRHKFAPSAEEGIVPEPEETREYSLGLRRNRGGDGAPHLTESGHARTRLRNTLRNIKMMGPHIDESSDVYYPWGKPGGGAPFVREDGKPFEEKLGWSLTGHPKKRSKEAKREYRSELEQEMEIRKQREQQERLQDPIIRIRPPQKMSKGASGAELVTLIRQGAGGGARKNPVTGELLPCHRLLTDVTKERLDIRRAKSQETLLYHSELAEQAEQRRQMRELQRQMERAQSEKHVSTWDSFWGRPGHGAPRDPENHKKENIESLLMGTKTSEPYVKHYVREIVPSKHKNRYEYPTKDVMVVKRDYEFRTPFPATEA